jgi:hypothetical protein
MATPVSEQIVLKIKQRLQLIDEDSGYETTVAGTVVRPPRIWSGNPEDYQVVVTQGAMQINDELSHPGNPPATAWNMPIVIFGELRPSEDNTTAIDTLINEFASDAVKAICTPASSWYNWDSLAINTIIDNVEPIVGEEACGFKLEMTVIYRVTENDPYQVRG